MKIIRSKTSGFGMLISIMIISFSLTSLVLAANSGLLGSGMLMTQWENKEQSYWAARGCLGEVEVLLVKNPTYKVANEDVKIPIEDASCKIISIVNSGNIITATVQAFYKDIPTSLKADVTILQDSISFSLAEIHP